MGKVSDFVNKRWGCQTQAIYRLVVLNAVAPVVVMPPNPNRFSWTIFNIGAALAYFAWNGQPGALTGIQLAANGGMNGIRAEDEGELPVVGVWALGVAATTLYVVETVAI